MGLGYERLFYRAAQEFNDNGFHFVMGPRLTLGSRAAFRLEGRATYVPSSNAPAASGSSINFSATVGLSIWWLRMAFSRPYVVCGMWQL